MEPAKLEDLTTVYSNLVSVLVALGVFTLFILLLMGGFKYLTSGGDPKAVESAQKTISFAIGGFLLFVASYLILIIIANITGTNILGVTNILEFKIVR